MSQPMTLRVGPLRMPLTERKWAFDPPEAAHFVLHMIWPVLTLVAGVLLTMGVLDATPERCDVAQGRLPAEVHVLPDTWIFLVGIGAFVAGRYVSQWSQPREYTKRPNWNRAIGYGGWFWLFLLLSAVWFYEALGTAHVLSGAVTGGTGGTIFEPITYYIRCAANVDLADNNVGVWSMFTVGVLSGIVGHWFWAAHPPGGRRRKAT